MVVVLEVKKERKKERRKEERLLEINSFVFPPSFDANRESNSNSNSKATVSIRLFRCCFSSTREARERARSEGEVSGKRKKPIEGREQKGKTSNVKAASGG